MTLEAPVCPQTLCEVANATGTKVDDPLNPGDVQRVGATKRVRLRDQNLQTAETKMLRH